MGDSTHDVTVAEALTVSNNGSIHVPARFQAHHVGSCYNQEVQTRVETPDGPTEAMEFTAFVTAGSSITIPAEIREFGNIDAGDAVNVEMEPTGNSWSPDDGGRKDYTNDDIGIPDEEVTSDEKVEDAIESAEDEMDEKGLGELFGYDDDDVSETDPENHTAEEPDEKDDEEKGLGELFG